MMKGIGPKAGATPAVCIYQRFMPPDRSGAGKQALTLARVVRELGWDVILLTDSSEENPSSGLLAELPVERVPPMPPDPSYPQTLRYWLAVALKLSTMKAIDVLHVHSAAFHQVGAIPAARALGKPVLVRSSISGEFAGLDRSRSGRVQKRLLRLAGQFVVLSERLGEEYLAAGLPPERLNLVPNGVDTEHYHPVGPAARVGVRDELDLPSEGRILIFHGVFIERKSLLWLVDVLESRLEALDMTLLLVGGPARDEEATGYAARLREHIERSPARSRIIVREHEPAVHRYLQAADAYVLPSTGEGLSNALLEAMATGLVAFASRGSGSEDVIQEGRSGFLFEPRDDASFLRSLEAVFGSHPEHDPAAIGRRAVQRIEERFSIQATGREYVRLYEKLRR